VTAVSDPPVSQRLLDADRSLLLMMRTGGHRPALEQAAAAYSKLGEHAAIWIVLGLAGGLVDPRPGRRRLWLRGCTGVVAAYGLNFAVKLAVRRRRPDLPGLPPLTSTVSRLSFPSAHATTSFAAAAAYRDLVPAAWLYTAAILFGLTRPYLGVHYPSDVLAGAALGSILGAAARGDGAGSASVAGGAECR
jgi:membrane-associated phospholipid phosphatase